MLQSTNRFWSCYIIIQVLNLQKIKDCYKPPVQPTTAKLNTADGSPMSAIGTMALHLRIEEFKFTHNLLFVMNYQRWNLFLALTCKENSHCHMPGTKKETVTFKRKENF